EDGSVEQARVAIGARRAGQAEIVEGIEPGDRIVVAGTGKLRPGDRIAEAGAAEASEGRAMKLPDVPNQRPVFATVMSLLLMVLGVMAFSRLTLRELPAIDPPIVSVDVNYPGASAAVVETRITQVLEDALSGIEGIETIQSRSRNGRSSVSLEFTL